MTKTMTIDIEAGPMDHPECEAGRLLEIYDQQGEAALLNTLHADRPIFKRNGCEAVLEDGSCIVLVKRLNCYSFQANYDDDPLGWGNAIRPSRYGSEFEHPDLHRPDSLDLDLGLTAHSIFETTLKFLARYGGVNLPNGARLQAGLMVQMAPDSFYVLNEIIRDLCENEEDPELAGRIENVRAVLAERLIAGLPKRQLEPLNAVLTGLEGTGE